MKEQPLFVHDCARCRFLGRYTNADAPFIAPTGGLATQVDLYVCAKALSATALVRYGNDGPNYAAHPLALVWPWALTRSHSTYSQAILEVVSRLGLERVLGTIECGEKKLTVIDVVLASPDALSSYLPFCAFHVEDGRRLTVMADEGQYYVYADSRKPEMSDADAKTVWEAMTVLTEKAKQRNARAVALCWRQRRRFPMLADLARWLDVEWIFVRDAQPGDIIHFGDYLMEVATISPEREIIGKSKVVDMTGKRLHVLRWGGEWEDFSTDVAAGGWKALLLRRTTPTASAPLTDPVIIENERVNGANLAFEACARIADEWADTPAGRAIAADIRAKARSTPEPTAERVAAPSEDERVQAELAEAHREIERLRTTKSAALEKYMAEARDLRVTVCWAVDRNDLVSAPIETVLSLLRRRATPARAEGSRPGSSESSAPLTEAEARDAITDLVQRCGCVFEPPYDELSALLVLASRGDIPAAVRPESSPAVQEALRGLERAAPADHTDGAREGGMTAEEAKRHGYAQVSHKYRMLARLPEGRTGMQALAEVGSEYLQTLERAARSFYLRVLAKDKVVLSVEEFKKFKEDGGDVA